MAIEPLQSSDTLRTYVQSLIDLVAELSHLMLFQGDQPVVGQGAATKQDITKKIWQMKYS